MSTRLASTWAAGRAQAQRLALTSAVGTEAGRMPANPRARPTLLCQWRLDAASGRPVCHWIVQSITATSSATAPALWPRIAHNADCDVASPRGGQTDQVMMPKRAWPAATTPAGSRKGAA